MLSPSLSRTPRQGSCSRRISNPMRQLKCSPVLLRACAFLQHFVDVAPWPPKGCESQHIHRLRHQKATDTVQSTLAIRQLSRTEMTAAAGRGLISKVLNRLCVLTCLRAGELQACPQAGRASHQPAPPLGQQPKRRLAPRRLHTTHQLPHKVGDAHSHVPTRHTTQNKHVRASRARCCSDTDSS